MSYKTFGTPFSPILPAPYVRAGAALSNLLCHDARGLYCKPRGAEIVSFARCVLSTPIAIDVLYSRTLV